MTRRRIAAWSAAALLAVAVPALAVMAWHPRHHVDMVAALAAIARAEGPWDNPWDRQDAKVASLRASLQQERDPGRRLALQREIAQQYVNGGTPEPGIALLESMLERHHGRITRQDEETLKADIAFAYFRVGELSNCGVGIDASTCLFPLDAEGMHRRRLGATEAAQRYAALLDDPATEPDNALLYRWMLNIAHMQLGTWPGAIDPRWRIDPARFASDEPFPRFTEVAAERGVREFGRAGGVILEDFDNDGHLDLMVSHMGLDEPLQFYRNRGDGHFVRDTAHAGLDGLTGGLNLMQADYDNDGCIDVYVPRGAWFHDHGRIPGSLLRGHCDGTFTDVTGESGLFNDYPSQTAVWADFNGDGFLDLFIGNEILRAKVPWPPGTPNARLFINQRDGTFVDAIASSGIAIDGMIKGATADDFDNDGRPDLYVSVMGGPNHLFRNLGGASPRFEDVTAKAGVAEPAMSFTTWFFDADNDGWPDLFVSGYSARVSDIAREFLGDKPGAKGARPRLYRNNHDGTFTDVSAAMHLDSLLLTMGANYGDLDNDGWLDFYLGTGAAPLDNIVPNRMFRNVEGRDFHDVTTAGGFGHLQKGHGVAFGDLDGDGRQDVVAAMGGAMTGDKFTTAIFKNPGADGNHWIKLDLVGTQANRFGVGARVRVRVHDAAGRSREIWRTVGSGGSFGAASLRLQVGVGAAVAVDRVEVRWPGSDARQAVAGPIVVDARYELREGTPGLKRLPR